MRRTWPASQPRAKRQQAAGPARAKLRQKAALGGGKGGCGGGWLGAKDTLIRVPALALSFVVQRLVDEAEKRGAAGGGGCAAAEAEAEAEVEAMEVEVEVAAEEVEVGPPAEE